MSVDLTNSDKLDTSPLVDRYSNAVAKGSPLIKRIIPTGGIKRQPPRVTAMGVSTQKVLPTPTPPPTVAPAPVVTPPVVVSPTPAPSVPSSGGGGGGAPAPSADEAPTDKSADAIPTATTMRMQSDKDFYMKMWFWGLLVGGVAGYLYAKNKGKDLKTFALIGAGIGGFAGLVVEKTINKGVNPKSPNVTVVTAVPSVQSEQVAEQADEQQEQQ